MADDPNLDEELRGLLAQGRKIEAIRRYREATGAELTAAMKAVEALAGSETAAKPESVEDSLTTEITSLLEGGKKIQAVKLFRERTGLGLKEAKDAVEAIAAERQIVVPSGSGCLGVLLCLAALVALSWGSFAMLLAADASPAVSKLAFGTYSGYFVSNQFEPEAATSFLVVDNRREFDKVFGAAFVMGDQSHRLADEVFQSSLVLAVVRRGSAVWEYTVEQVTKAKGTVELRYRAAEKKSESAVFACPLIVSIPKGAYTAVEFVENGRTVKRLGPLKGALR